jgi:hypothetical protein
MFDNIKVIYSLRTAESVAHRDFVFDFQSNWTMRVFPLVELGRVVERVSRD